VVKELMEEDGRNASDPSHHGTVPMSKEYDHREPQGDHQGSQMPFGEEGIHRRTWSRSPWSPRDLHGRGFQEAIPCILCHNRSHLALSPMLQMLLGFSLSFPGPGYVLFLLSTLVYVYGGKPFLERYFSGSWPH